MSPRSKPTHPLLLVTMLSALALGMLGLSFAAVPIYRFVCAVTGMGGTTQRVDTASKTRLDRPITIRFDANIKDGLPWSFEAEQTTITTKLGDSTLAFYKAKNLSNHAVTGQAVFNVTPEIAGRFFNKIECFCFTEQTLAPGEEVDMPVTFYVDPAILSEPGAESIQSITLSYTFFEVPATKAAAVTKPAGTAPDNKRGG
jgi:cytochrome c oxidase assembly protein subunit 11